jgi:hypothetical protein
VPLTKSLVPSNELLQKYQDGDWWIGWIEELPGVNCQEATYEELLDIAFTFCVKLSTFFVGCTTFCFPFFLLNTNEKRYSLIIT